VATDLDEQIDRLYGLDQGEFTAERDALAKSLRKQDRAAADRVKALRKPVTAAWAANQVARRRPKLVTELLKAGETLRNAQAGMLSGGDRDAVRRAVEDEREWVDRIVEEARACLSRGEGKATQATLDAVRQTLHAAATSDEVRELVRSGRLVEEQSAAGFGMGDLAVAPSKANSRPKPKSKPEPKKPTKAEEKRRRDAEKRARERVTAAKKELTAAKREERDAAKRMERGEAAAARAQEALEQASEALRGAREETARREQALHDAEGAAP
jgi:hypothetical protein